MVAERVHTQTTTRSGYRYCFLSKHHGAGTKNDARWIVHEAQEFAIFDWADANEVSDGGDLYGAAPDGDDSLLILGADGEQLAKFPCPSQGSPWHGHPASWLGDLVRRPPRAVFHRLIEVGLLTQRMARRLMKGHAI